MDYPLVDNVEAKQYEFHIDGLVPRVEYIKMKNLIYLTHTEVPAGLKGRGIGGILVEKVLQQIEKEGLSLMPLCPFVAKYLKEHPEWKRILDNRVKIE